MAGEVSYKVADLDIQNVGNSGKRLNSFSKLCSTSRKELTNYQSRTWGYDLGFFLLQKKPLQILSFLRCGRGKKEIRGKAEESIFNKSFLLRRRPLLSPRFEDDGGDTRSSVGRKKGAANKKRSLFRFLPFSPYPPAFLLRRASIEQK